MPYEEDSRRPERSVCACGRGFLRRYRVVESNDWDQRNEYYTRVEFFCDYCKNNYHYEKNDYGEGFLVPNGLQIPEPITPLEKKSHYTTDEEFVGAHDEMVISEMLDDMTDPKHRFIKDLKYPPAIDFANGWVRKNKRRSLEPMANYLRCILSNFEELQFSRNNKKPTIEEHEKLLKERKERVIMVQQQSFKPSFSYDEQQDKLDHEIARKEQEEYAEAHKYDSFNARVTYDDSCKVDSTGGYWDSFHIVECIDPQFLILDKPQYGSATITVVKKYRCKCIACGNERVVDSSSFHILYDVDRGFYPILQCECHKTTSFEAKAMDILLSHGISFAREYSFEGLIGDAGHQLRFDFALFDPIIGDGRCKSVRLLLELQGPHHYKQGEYDEFGYFIEDKTNISVSAKNRSEKQLRYDRMKQQYCEKCGIPLELIEYTSSSYDKLEERIIGILKKYGFDGNDDDLPF